MKSTVILMALGSLGLLLGLTALPASAQAQAQDQAQSRPQPAPAAEEYELRELASPERSTAFEETSWTAAFPKLPGHGWSVFGMLGMLLISLLLVTLLSGLRRGLPVEGLIPGTLALIDVLLQIFALLTAAGVVARLLPHALQPAVPWAIIAVAVAVGWSSRDVLPDLVAAVVISFERRIRPGIWMSTGTLSGLVEGRGLRAVWLRDGHGNRIAVPNRQLLTTHISVQEAAGPVHEVALRVADLGPTKVVRKALLEATLTSPWVRPDTAPVVRQDGGDPELWHIRAHLLEMRFAGRFEGDLLERTEEVLDALRSDELYEKGRSSRRGASENSDSSHGLDDVTGESGGQV